MTEKKKHAGHGFKKIHVENHKDGSHTVHYEHEDGPEYDVKHAVASIDHLHDSLEDHLGGEPNDEESALDNGQHGIPDEHAQAADLPVQAAEAGGQ